MKNNEKALAAFVGEIEKAHYLLSKINEALDNHMEVSPEDINWGQVGSAQHMVELLGEIAEFIK